MDAVADHIALENNNSRAHRRLSLPAKCELPGNQRKKPDSISQNLASEEGDEKLKLQMKLTF
jgi:hypothetical protein